MPRRRLRTKSSGANCEGGGDDGGATPNHANPDAIGHPGSLEKADAAAIFLLPAAARVSYVCPRFLLTELFHAGRRTRACEEVGKRPRERSATPSSRCAAAPKPPGAVEVSRRDPTPRWAVWRRVVEDREPYDAAGGGQRADLFCARSTVGFEA